LTISAGFAPAGRADMALCDNVILKEGRLTLNRNQKTLVCGSSRGREGWRDVPLTQAQFQLNVILQNDGYPEPRFERDGGRLFVWAGRRPKIQEFVINGGGGHLKARKKRKLRGEALTPGRLDETKQWGELILKTHGHACPVVAVAGRIWDGRVVMNAEPGFVHRIGHVERAGLEKLDAAALARFEAFEPGQLYDVRKVELTATRMLDAGVLQSAYFTTACRGEWADLRLHADIGKPRVFRFGVGASTEEFPFTDIWFRNARLDDRASFLNATLHASPVSQSLTLGAELYVLPWSRRSFFGPRFGASRKVERSFEVLKSGLGADLGRHWDKGSLRLSGRAGPTLNYEKTVVGIGPEAAYLSWEGTLTAMSHQYEIAVRDQYSGWLAQFEYRGQREGIGSEINVDRYDLGVKLLWNIRDYSPPLFVLGTRIDLTGVNANPLDLRSRRNLLPVDYRIFSGGNDNLRGFPRQSLNNGGLGYLTAAYLGFELRLVEQIPFRLQPFLLWDAARFGDQRFTLEPPVFTSAGAGLRWASPFGTLRGSAARGSVWGGDASTARYPQEWVYFVSFGQEF
jgi:translocation and assembly module TamA